MAKENELVGFVRNRGDALVEIVVEGKKSNIKKFLLDLKSKKPPLAQILNIRNETKNEEEGYKEFKIIKSSSKASFSGSIIPTDISICNKCLEELRDPKNRRFNYFFITCTNCGPRYTIIKNLPYDRLNTTMNGFQMCNSCAKDFGDPSNRRFHSQTVACTNCGPEVYLASNSGEPIESERPIKEAGRLLEEGNIVAVKGNGGFHISTATTRSEPIIKLRKNKYRKQKPFAIMAPNIKTIETFAKVHPWEANLLGSYRKPIVLLKKSCEYYLSKMISPNLHSIGVMLPYTGLHNMLFDEIKEPALIMTSANPPNEPIVIRNHEAITKLGSTVDYFLFHNRLIGQRCDDSVVRFHGKKPCLIRRSRGYTPEPIQLKSVSNHCTLAVGGELNVTSCLITKNNAFISQHIGDVKNFENLRFLKNSIAHLTKITNCEVETVACDLHPNFTTTKLAWNLGKKLGCPVIQVQHHHAHAAALMAECKTEEIVAITCDGFGYGLDGKAWGGEILHCNSEGFKRLGHLEKQPMVGGDLATIHPLRIATGILNKKIDVFEWLATKSNLLPYGQNEAELIVKQLEKGIVPETTSCGRVLDAVSALLGVCYHRSYEGEPAMKLESVAINGKEVLNLKPRIKGNVLDTTYLVHQIFLKREKLSVADLAHTAQSYIARGLAELAIKEAEKLNVKHIGFSGGVAYNEQITTNIHKLIENVGFKFLIHNRIPTGDGGTSFGQAIVASFHK